MHSKGISLKKSNFKKNIKEIQQLNPANPSSNGMSCETFDNNLL